MTGGDSGRFMLSPLGVDIALWRNPRRDRPEVPRLLLDGIPGPIVMTDAVDHPDAYYGEGRSISLSIDGVTLPLDQVCFCDLSDRTADGSSWNARGTVEELARVRIDPQRGRVALPSEMVGLEADSLRAIYYYGTAVDVGGGGYYVGQDRALDAEVPKIASRTDAEASLADALKELEKPAANTRQLWWHLVPAACADASGSHRGMDRRWRRRVADA